MHKHFCKHCNDGFNCPDSITKCKTKRFACALCSHGAPRFARLTIYACVIVAAVFLLFGR